MTVALQDPAGARDEPPSSAFRQLVFLLGAPRSGTTWLQLLLYQHALVASSQETHLFDWYIGNLYRTWEREGRTDFARPIGLRGLLTDATFDDAVRAYAGAALRAISARHPGATVLLEKTPSHVEHWRTIHRLYPNARFIHLIRDPRAVVASLKRASATWASGWAPRSPIDGARMWASAVGERDAMRERLGDLYAEVRYEDLRREPETRLADLFAWLGLGMDADAVRAAVAACEVNGLANAATDVKAPWDLGAEPDGFYRGAPVEHWRAELSARDVRMIEYITGAAMVELGYALDYPGVRGKPLVLALRDLAGTLVERATRRLVREAPWIVAVAEKVARR